MIIFVAGPYGDHLSYWKIEQNIMRADAVARGLCAMGHEPVCPHNLTRHWELDLRLCRADFIRLDDALLEKCDALFFVASSPGADRELKLAQSWGKEIFYNLGQVPARK